MGLATCSGGSCSTSQIASIYNYDAIGVAITMGADGNPVVFYEDSGCCQGNGPADSVHYYTNAADTIVASDGRGDTLNHDIFIGPDGFARMTYTGGPAGTEFVECTNSGCTGSTTTSIPGGATPTSMVVAADGNAVMEHGAVEYLQCTTSDCSKYNDQILSGNWANSSVVSLNLGPDGLGRMIAQQGSPNAPGPVEHIRPKVPTSAVIEPPPGGNVLTTYTNQTQTSCDGNQSSPNRYGYQRCVTYQVKDQDGNDFQKVIGIHEDVRDVDHTVNTIQFTGDSSTNAVGEFLDQLALLNNPNNPQPLPANTCSISKQTFTGTGNNNPIRVNCLQFSATDVTITDVTANPSQCSKPTYHCN